MQTKRMITWLMAPCLALTLGLAGAQPSHADDGGGTETPVTGAQLQGGSTAQLPSGTTITVPTPQPAGTPFVTDGSQSPFDTSAVANWALANAQDTGNPLFPGCAWFASQALWAGGLAQTPDWNSTAGQAAFGLIPGTPDSRAVDLLLAYLTTTYPASTFEGMNLDPGTDSGAQVGDLIFYDWDGDGVWDHVAVVTGVEPSGYPDVSEWGVGNLLDGSATPYTQRGWTWSQLHGEWLQQEPGQSNMRAALLHIDTTVPSTY